MILKPLAFGKKPCVGCSRGRAWSISNLRKDVLVGMERIVQLTSAAPCVIHVDNDIA